MIRISTYKIRIPKPGQEGGGVAWGPWLPASPADFEKVLATAESGKCGSCNIRAFHTATQYFEIDINAWTGAPTYSVVKQFTSEPEVVTYKEFRRLLKIDEGVETIELPASAPDAKAEQEEVHEYLFRFRHFKNPNDAWKGNCGWSDWEFCDAVKYSEVVHFIKSGATYQAQMIPVKPSENFCFDLKAHGWHAPRYRYRETSEEACTQWAEITKERYQEIRKYGYCKPDRWYEYEISLDNGVTWEHI